MKNWLARMGQHPQKSWAHFRVGLAFFILAVTLILFGAQGWYWLQIPGLIALVVAIFFAAWGYLGLLANRLSRSLFKPRKAPPSFEDN